mmetsp:Transcript_12548/g.44442  ORF Transcript_12548/g.44442 Transcript_12548/m.44442 type:complete len:252 (-) Transcript_12548:2256-3011(-)
MLEEGERRALQGLREALRVPPALGRLTEEPAMPRHRVLPGLQVAFLVAWRSRCAVALHLLRPLRRRSWPAAPDKLAHCGQGGPGSGQVNLLLRMSDLAQQRNGFVRCFQGGLAVLFTAVGLQNFLARTILRMLAALELLEQLQMCAGQCVQNDTQSPTRAHTSVHALSILGEIPRLLEITFFQKSNRRILARLRQGDLVLGPAMLRDLRTPLLQSLRHILFQIALSMLHTFLRLCIARVVCIGSLGQVLGQ